MRWICLSAVLLRCGSTVSFLGCVLINTPVLAQMQWPQIFNILDIVCVFNLERQFKVIRFELWEIKMAWNQQNSFTFRERIFYVVAILLQSFHNNQSKALLDLRKQQIIYISPDNLSYNLCFEIQAFANNGCDWRNSGQTNVLFLSMSTINFGEFAANWWLL